MKKLITSYEKSVSNNIQEIQSILKTLGMTQKELLPAYKQVLTMSSKNISGKWKSGRKYARTLFVKRAFSKNYPEKITELSLTIDAMVNILDDFYDEKMSQDEKALYIIEYLRVFALYSNINPDKKIQKAVGLYFNKLITLAVAENIYLVQIKKEKALDKIIEYSAGLLLCRSMDIDIFNEVALVNYKDKKLANKTMLMGRIFRAINILKKDIVDIEYDKKNNLESVVTHVFDKKGKKFIQYIDGLVTHLFEYAKKNHILVSKGTANIPLNNYFKLINKEVKEIKTIMSKKHNSQ
ncbi:hypothetical protein ACFLZ9_00525 [Patescibacteria group bacterium]